MTIDEAIETNQEHAKEHNMNVDQSYFRALNLDIEALKKVKAGRPPPPSLAFLPLPGETSCL